MHMVVACTTLTKNHQNSDYFEKSFEQQLFVQYFSKYCIVINSYMPYHEFSLVKCKCVKIKGFPNQLETSLH